MHIPNILKNSTVTVAALLTFLSLPALAQDCFDTTTEIHNDINNTGSVSERHAPGEQEPCLLRGTNGTIGPQPVTVIERVNTAGTVRSNNMQNIEHCLEWIAAGMQILGYAWGLPTLFWGIMQFAATDQGRGGRKLFSGTSSLGAGFLMPTVIQYLEAWSRPNGSDCLFN